MLKDKNGKVLGPGGDLLAPETWSKNIDPLTKRRDRLVERVLKKTEKLNKQIVDTKNQVMDLVDGYLDKLADEQNLDAWQGNIELPDFAGTVKVRVKTSKIIEFDERLQVAKQILDGCFEKWFSKISDKLEGVGGRDAIQNLRLVVNKAFGVDDSGKIDKKMILSLRQYKVRDKDWKRAMDLISQSVRVVNTRRYVTVFVRRNKLGDRAIGGDWEVLELNWSKV